MYIFIYMLYDIVTYHGFDASIVPKADTFDGYMDYVKR